MALMGTFIDKTANGVSQSAAAAAFITITHALGTSPDHVWIEPRSIAGGAAPVLACVYDSKNISIYVGSLTGTADVFAQIMFSIIK